MRTRVGLYALTLMIGGLSSVAHAASPEAGSTKDLSAPKVTAQATMDMTSLHIDAAKVLSRGEALYKAEDYAKSYEAFQKVFVQDRGNIDAIIGLGNSALALGLNEEALNIFKHLKDKNLSDARKPAMASGLALSKIATSTSKNDVITLRSALKDNPADPRLWNALGRYYDAQGLWIDSLDAYVRAMATGSARSSVVNNLGMSLMMQGRNDEAFDKFHQALALKPGSELYDNNRRLLLALEENYIAALRGLTSDRAALLLNDAGYIAMKRGETRLAKVLLTRAISLSPVYHPKAEANLEALKSQFRNG